VVENIERQVAVAALGALPVNAAMIFEKKPMT
jgi:hypothetical protein